jgi:hypothetical protein
MVHIEFPLRLRRMSEPSFLHPSQEPSTRPHPTAERRARSHPVGQRAPKDRRVCEPLLRSGGHRGNLLAGGSQAFGLRQARYQGLQKTHLQELATAASINVGRITKWLNGVPSAVTLCCRLAALAPACGSCLFSESTNSILSGLDQRSGRPKDRASNA